MIFVHTILQVHIITGSSSKYFVSHRRIGPYVATLLILAQKDLPWIVAVFVILNISIGGGLYLSFQGINHAHSENGRLEGGMGVFSIVLFKELSIINIFSLHLSFLFSFPSPISFFPSFLYNLPLSSEIYEVWNDGFIKATVGHSADFGYPEYVCYQLLAP